VVMRPGNAGSNTVADHIAVLTQAIAQVPASHRGHILIHADGAGSSHGLLDWLTEQGTKRGRTVEADGYRCSKVDTRAYPIR
jgi:hypothetical protein